MTNQNTNSLQVVAKRPISGVEKSRKNPKAAHYSSDFQDAACRYFDRVQSIADTAHEFGVPNRVINEFLHLRVTRKGPAREMGLRQVSRAISA